MTSPHIEPERYLSGEHLSSGGVDLRGVVVDDHTPWERDYTCRALVVHHPDGMTLAEVAAVLRRRYCGRYGGTPISRERVRQIEASALRKLRRELRRLVARPEIVELFELFAAQAAEREANWEKEWGP